MTSGTKPNTSLVLTDAELDFIRTHFAGSKSSAIHKALGDIMNTTNLTDNAWVERVNQLRQMVADVPEAPKESADVEWYIESFNTEDDNLSADDIKFLHKEFERQYGVN